MASPAPSPNPAIGRPSVPPGDDACPIGPAAVIEEFAMN
jgi:hypothetical protein